jgi:hypothetical protein
VLAPLTVLLAFATVAISLATYQLHRVLTR